MLKLRFGLGLLLCAFFLSGCPGTGALFGQKQETRESVSLAKFMAMTLAPENAAENVVCNESILNRKFWVKLPAGILVYPTGTTEATDMVEATVTKTEELVQGDIDLDFNPPLPGKAFEQLLAAGQEVTITRLGTYKPTVKGGEVYRVAAPGAKPVMLTMSDSDFGEGPDGSYRAASYMQYWKYPPTAAGLKALRRAVDID